LVVALARLFEAPGTGGGHIGDPKVNEALGFKGLAKEAVVGVQ